MLRLASVTFLLHAYVAWRLVPDLPMGTAGVVLTLAWLVASATLMPLGLAARRLRRQPLADRLAWAGLLAAGSFSSLFVLTVIRDAALSLAWAAGWFFGGGTAPVLPAFLRSASAAGVLVLAGLFTLVGLINARRRARVRTVEVPIANLPASLNGFSIAQISDLHVGQTIKRGYVEAVVKAVNALEADMIALTGDMVDGSVRDLARHTAPLAGLASRHGSYFVTGNHEYYSGASAWMGEMRRLGMHVLVNEHVVLEHGGEALVIAGVTDYSTRNVDAPHGSNPAAAMAGAPLGAAVKLLLAHQPRSAFAAASAGFDLQLSGHTHGGQFFPWNFFVRLQQPFTAGLHRLDALWVYVSRGTGYWGPPKRLGAPSEITHLRLVRA